MRSERAVVTRAPEETAAEGETLARSLRPGDVVALTGELGAGKTCFVQGVARGLGVEAPVTSPTFTLVNEYRGRLPIHHVDAYRLRGVADLLDLGIEEYLDGAGVTVIEWGEKASGLLPDRAIHVHLDGAGDEPRAITIRRPST